MCESSSSSSVGMNGSNDKNHHHRQSHNNSSSNSNNGEEISNKNNNSGKDSNGIDLKKKKKKDEDEESSSQEKCKKSSDSTIGQMLQRCMLRSCLTCCPWLFFTLFSLFRYLIQKIIVQLLQLAQRIRSVVFHYRSQQKRGEENNGKEEDISSFCSIIAGIGNRISSSCSSSQSSSSSSPSSCITLLHYCSSGGRGSQFGFIIVILCSLSTLYFMQNVGSSFYDVFQYGLNANDNNNGHNGLATTTMNGGANEGFLGYYVANKNPCGIITPPQTSIELHNTTIQPIIIATYPGSDHQSYSTSYGQHNEHEQTSSSSTTTNSFFNSKSSSQAQSQSLQPMSLLELISSLTGLVVHSHSNYKELRTILSQQDSIAISTHYPITNTEKLWNPKSDISKCIVLVRNPLDVIRNQFFHIKRNIITRARARANKKGFRRNNRKHYHHNLQQQQSQTSSTITTNTNNKNEIQQHWEDWCNQHCEYEIEHWIKHIKFWINKYSPSAAAAAAANENNYHNENDIFSDNTFNNNNNNDVLLEDDLMIVSYEHLFIKQDQQQLLKISQYLEEQYESNHHDSDDMENRYYQQTGSIQRGYHGMRGSNNGGYHQQQQQQQQPLLAWAVPYQESNFRIIQHPDKETSEQIMKYNNYNNIYNKYNLSLAEDYIQCIYENKIVQNKQLQLRHNQQQQKQQEQDNINMKTSTQNTIYGAVTRSGTTTTTSSSSLFNSSSFSLSSVYEPSQYLFTVEQLTKIENELRTLLELYPFELGWILDEYLESIEDEKIKII